MFLNRLHCSEDSPHPMRNRRWSWRIFGEELCRLRAQVADLQAEAGKPRGRGEPCDTGKNSCFVFTGLARFSHGGRHSNGSEIKATLIDAVDSTLKEGGLSFAI